MAGTEDTNMTEEHPKIAVSLAINPSTLVLGENKPTLRITATLQGATRPITIFAYSSIFNIRLAVQRTNFKCEDLTTGESLCLEQIKGPQRPGFQHYRGSYDDKHHLTLNPDVPRTFEHPFTISTKPKLQAGHRYAFGLAEGQGIGWWCWGTKAEVLREKIEPRPVSEPRRIIFEPVAPVEFVVETNDTEPKLDNEN